jgi:hypothetical protein
MSINILASLQTLKKLRPTSKLVSKIVIPALALGVAIVTAWQGQVTISHNTQSTLRQSEDTQLSTAITALGDSESAQRIAGLVLLARNAGGRFQLSAEAGEPSADVYDDYTTALQILSGYLNSHSQTYITAMSTAKTTKPFRLGYGMPPSPGIPLDIIYAADQVTYLLNSKMQSNVTRLNAGEPTIDLAHDELFGQPWPGINFRWISAWLVGIDLRGANLEQSKWGKDSHLSYSYLQCANLGGAKFGQADLKYVDLRGANVQGADFSSAHIEGANLTQVYGKATWPRQLGNVTSLPVQAWHQDACLRNSSFWRS